MKANKSVKMNYYLPMFLVNIVLALLIVISIVAITGIFASDGLSIKDGIIGLIIGSLLLIPLDIMFVLIRKIISDVIINDEKVYVIYRKRVVRTISIDEVVFIYLNRNTISLCLKCPDTLTSSSINKVINDKTSLNFVIDNSKLKFILAYFNVDTLYISKYTCSSALKDIESMRVIEI